MAGPCGWSSASTSSSPTGHAFQVFLTDADQLALLKTIAVHLAPNGRFIFDSRNPRGEEWLEWGLATPIVWSLHPKHGAVESWNDYAHDAATGVVTYDTFTDCPAASCWPQNPRSRFTSQEHIATLIGEAGLKVDRWLGDWQGAAFTPESREIIPLGRLV